MKGRFQFAVVCGILGLWSMAGTALAQPFLIAHARPGVGSQRYQIPYEQTKNIVYAETHGVGLVMDVFVPTGKKNGLGVVDVVSGAWRSDRSKIRQHELAQVFRILCKQGYTVFGVRPGSITKFSGPEMLANVRSGIRWVKSHAEEYGVDPDRLGLMGASAGGHLACLAAVTADQKPTEEGDTPPGAGTRVKAAAVFFPPTDFLNLDGKAIDVRGDDRWARYLRRLAFPRGLEGVSDEEVTARIKAISPARLVTPSAPSFLLIHGDADPLVPLQQSQVMVAALEGAGVPVQLIVKKGGGHPWLTMHEEVQVLADWFDKTLSAE